MSFGGSVNAAKKSYEANRRLGKRKKDFKDHKVALRRYKTPKPIARKRYKFLDRVNSRAEQKAFVQRENRVYLWIMLILFLSSMWYLKNYGALAQ